MHFSMFQYINAQSNAVAQPCMTAYYLYHNTYDPGISPGSANQCILGDVYLRSNLSRKTFGVQIANSASRAHKLATCIKVFAQLERHNNTAGALLQTVMAFRMICKSLASKSVAAAALPRAASSQLYHPHAGGLRHAAGILSRTAWFKEPTSLLSLRQFNSSAVVKSALTDILQEEIKYEEDNYQPPEVCSMLRFPASFNSLFQHDMPCVS